MTKQINSAQVLYKRKSPATYEIMEARLIKNWQGLVDSAEELRDYLGDEAKWLAWMEEHGSLESYLEAKATLEHVRKRKAEAV